MNSTRFDHDGGPRTVGNFALEPVTTRMMTGEEFRSYLDSHPHVALAMLRDHSPAAYRRSAKNRLGSSATTRRLARLLVELVEEYGQPTPTSVDVDIPLAQQELASLIALASQSRYLTATP